jgi:hypothetical protein
MSREFESYDDLFIDERTVDSLTEKKEFYENTETGLDKFSTEKKNELLKSDKSTENVSNEESLEEKYEQNHIITSDNNDFSFEADDDESFAEAAEESPNSNNEEESSDGNDMDFDSGDDMDFDEGSMDADGDSMDDSGNETGSDGDGGIDVIDNNKGSSLNPYTQINQKRWAIDTLNELSKTIQNALNLYNPLYADWSEVDHLKQLGKMVEDEKRSFIMQQNPENLINVGLYYEACDVIVQKILDRINVEKNKERSS